MDTQPTPPAEPPSVNRHQGHTGAARPLTPVDAGR